MGICTQSLTHSDLLGRLGCPQSSCCSQSLFFPILRAGNEENVVWGLRGAACPQRDQKMLSGTQSCSNWAHPLSELPHYPTPSGFPAAHSPLHRGLLPSQQLPFPSGVGINYPRSSPPSGTGFTVRISEFTRRLQHCRLAPSPPSCFLCPHSHLSLHPSF